MWRWHLALPIFAVTLFVSAFLLFLVQPMIGKLILPKLGGTPMVWNTCMVFFQSVLLLGYAYTHTISTRLKLRQQLTLHSALLLLPIIMMVIFPFYSYVQDRFDPTTEGNPIVDTLICLAIVVGVPFFVVSTSAPLLQKWFAYSGDPSAKDPYFLYGASNLGSMLSLILYPFAIEPATLLPQQTTIWFVGYIVFAAMVVFCAYKIYQVAPSDEAIAASAAAELNVPPPVASEPTPAPAPAPVTPAQASTAVKSGDAPAKGGPRRKAIKLPGQAEPAPSIAAPTHAPIVQSGVTAPMTTLRRIRWILLAMVPSSLMLGVTSYVSTDLSPFPLVWAIPLSLYLLSFILVFMQIWTLPKVANPMDGSAASAALTAYGPLRLFYLALPETFSFHQLFIYVFQPLGLIALCFIVMKGGFDPFFATTIVMLGFFACTMACHGELAVDRPSPRYLTEFFLLMSVGGMLGGVFNSLVAPTLFESGVWEFHIAIVLAALVRPQYVQSGWFDELILSAFPGFKDWTINQGDELAKSSGRPAPRSTYMFNYFLDVALGLFVLALAYYLSTKYSARYRDTQDNTLKIMKFIGLPMTSKWLAITSNILTIGIPAIFCFFFAGRPLRITIAIAGLLLGSLYFASREDVRETIESRRTYFGILRVMRDEEYVRDEEEARFMTKGGAQNVFYPNTYLMHGTTHHGRNYYANYYDEKLSKEKNAELAKGRVDISRLATTYYHRYGPVGTVMEQWNWLPGEQNSFRGDLRMPATLIGQIAASICSSSIPIVPLVDIWSEPPFATIGLGTGTMASYARPYQHMTYYEIDEQIRQFSLPDEGREARFTYLQGAVKRGVNLEVIMGDARQSLDPRREKANFKNSFVYSADFSKAEKPAIQKPVSSKVPDRERYYKAINVDAFSSDAIPVHLVTKQSIEIYMNKLTDDGVLMVHTSNRHMDLVRPVARIAMELSEEHKAKGLPEINCLVGKDHGSSRYMGHFSSEYVMIFRGDGFAKLVDKMEKRRIALLNPDKEGPDFLKKMENIPRGGRDEGTIVGRAPAGEQILNSTVEWYNPYTDHTDRGQKRPVTKSDPVWTDDYSHILSVLR